MKIIDVKTKCSKCKWKGTVKDCEPDIDNDGSLGCPVCSSIITIEKNNALNDYGKEN